MKDLRSLIARLLGGTSSAEVEAIVSRVRRAQDEDLKVHLANMRREDRQFIRAELREAIQTGGRLDDFEFARGATMPRSVQTDPARLGRVETREFAAQVAAIAAAAKTRRGKRIPASAFVVNYNEGAAAELSLLSVLEFEQVVFVDKGSSDGSENLADRYGVERLDAPWTPVVEDTRAAADAVCRHEWRLFLDGDEFLDPAAVAITRHLLEQDAEGKLAYDVVRFPRLNYLGGQLAQKNVYAPAPVARLYRAGFYDHAGSTHEVKLSGRARVLTLPASLRASILHFNQDNFWEYLEKLNRYTETYRTSYAPPSRPEEIFAFVQSKLNEAAGSVEARGGGVLDASWEILTAFYYIVEYLKQHEDNAPEEVDRRYAQIVREARARLTDDHSNALESLDDALRDGARAVGWNDPPAEFVLNPQTNLRVAVDNATVAARIRTAIAEGTYETSEAQVLPRLVRPDDSVLELGAGLGFVSTLLMKQVRPQRYTAVEADPRLIPLIERTHKLNGVTGVSVVQAIASENPTILERGYAGFQVDEEFWASHAVDPALDVSVLRIPVVSLSKLIADNEVTFIVADIEGGETELFDNVDLSAVRAVELELHRSQIGAVGVAKVFDTLHRQGLMHDGEFSTWNNLAFIRM